MRRRAGHGYTCFQIGEKTIRLIFSEDGRWITSGEAREWRRCPRCRAPFQYDPFDSGLCVTCYFYHSISTERFWELHDSGYWLAPYNLCANMPDLDWNKLRHGNWREALAEQKRDNETSN